MERHSHNHHNRHWYQKKKFLIPLFLILIVFGLTFAVEPFALKKANEMAKKVNPEFKGHIKDLDISFFRGAVVLEGVTASLKKNGREFMTVDDVAVDLAWRELFRGNILFDVVIDRFNVKFAKDILAAAKRLPKSEKEEAKAKFRIAEIAVYDSKITMLGYPGLEKDKNFQVKNINGTIRDLTQRENTELAKYDFGATLTGKDKIKLTGNLDIAAKPPRWDLNAKLNKFQLTSTNKALREMLPLDYKKGSVDIYSEVKSEKGKIYGYIKPFLNDVQYQGNATEYKGAKHFLIEAVGRFANWTLENDKKDTVATRIPFIYENGVFSTENGEALEDVIQHGLTESKLVDRGIEQKYRLNAPNPKEVQAQEADLEEKKEEKKEEAKVKKEEEEDK